MENIRIRYRFRHKEIKELVLQCLLPVEVVEKQSIEGLTPPNPFNGAWDIESRDLCTGWSDTKGQLICEGDITNNGIVRWGNFDDSYIGFYLEDVEWCKRGGKKHHDTHDFFGFTTPFRILGNIHEHPELTKVRGYRKAVNSKGGD